MRLGRTLPPAASPIPLVDIFRALPALLRSHALDSRFSQEIMQEFGSQYCFLLSSGKAALTVSLLALKKIYPDRDQVVLPALTCYTVPAAVKRAGLRIRLCDLAPSSLDFDKERLREIIAADQQEKKILCVLATHLFGCPVDFAGIRTIVGSEIPIIEDAAQAMGETSNARKLGTLGDIGFFSLGRGKALSTMEGGIIVTSRVEFANIITSLIVSLTDYSLPDTMTLAFKAVMANVLQHPALFWLPKVLPFLSLGETLYETDFPLQRLSPFQVKLAENWLMRLKQHMRAREKNIDYWYKRLPASFVRLCRRTNISLIRMPILAQSMGDRDNILRQSEHRGLGIMPAYPTTINRIASLAHEFLAQDCPQAEDVCNRLMTIPVHEYVRDKDNEGILALLMEARHSFRNTA